jgi:DNA polymerase bacteriophage-type
VGERLRTLYIDFESLSPLVLEDVGVDVYFSHPQTKITMMAYAWDEGDVELWQAKDGPFPQELKDAFVDPDITKVAWNAPFECTGSAKKLGVIIPPEQVMDPSVGARHLSMPGGLEKVGTILNLPHHLSKNADRGGELVSLFCCPIPPKKKKIASDMDSLFDISPLSTAEVIYQFRNEITNPKEWEEFGSYCRQDIVAERALLKMVNVFPITPTERRMWVLDQKINRRGIAADRSFATKCFNIAKKNKFEYTDKLKVMTGLDNPNSNDQMLAWAREGGYPYNSLRKEPVRAALTDDQVHLTDICREALSILKYSKKSSYTKLEAITTALSADDRLRDQFLFYGSARAGRWTGRNVQMQNIARPIKAIEKKGALDKALQLIRDENYEGLKLAFPDDPVIEVATSCIRSAFVAVPGKRLDVCDLNAIENRVLGWIADEQAILDVFRQGKCPYLDFAADWFSVPYAVINAAYENDDPDAKFKRQISKPAVLGCGYRQSGGDWGTNKYGDRVKTGLWKYAEDMFCPMTKDQAHEAVAVFRGRFKKVVNLWYDSERAVARCLKNGTTEWIGPTQLVWCDRRKRKNGKFILRIHLPSGRCLHYIDARVDNRENTGKDGSKYMKDTILYMGIDQVSKQWVELTTHGGKIVENIVQAIARDLLVEGMLKADEIGLTIVGHVHDEIITENDDTPDGMGLDDLVWCMSQVPDWAPGLPLTAKGYSGYYYKK